jgi:hypothetical protein
MDWGTILLSGLGLGFGIFLFIYFYSSYSRDYSPRKALKITLTKVILFYIVFAPILLGVFYELSGILPDHWLAETIVYLVALGAARLAYAGVNLIVNRIWNL